MAYTTAPAGSATAATTYQELLGTSGTWAFVLGIRDGRTTTATTLAIERKQLQRSTGGTVSVTLTPGLFTTREPAATITATTTWTAAPSASGNALVWLSATEKHEAVYQWRPPRPWAAPQITDAEQIDLRGSSASNVATFLFSQGPPPPTGRLARRPRRNGLWHYRNEHRAYTHSSASPAYDINRPVSTNWVARVPSARLLRPNLSTIQSAGNAVLLLATLTAGPAISGSITRSRAIGGTLAAGPAMSGSLSRARALLSTLSAAPAISGTISRARALGAALSAAPAISGSISRARHLATTLAAAPAIAGSISRSRALAASLGAQPAITGSISRARALTSTLTAAPAITGSLTRARQLGAALAAAPGLAGSLTLSGVTHLAGTLAASPAITGTLARGRQLGGTLGAQPAVSGTVSRSRALLATLAASPGLSGILASVSPTTPNPEVVTVTFPARGSAVLAFGPARTDTLTMPALPPATLTMAAQSRTISFPNSSRTLTMTPH